MKWTDIYSSPENALTTLRIDFKTIRHFLDSFGVMTDSKGEMMGRAGGAPTFQESPHIGFKPAVGISVSGWGNRAGHRFPFGYDEFELPRRVEGYSEHGDRAGSDIEFDTGPGARFAVIFLQTANDRFAIGNVQMMRTVMADQYGIAFKVYRMEFRKTAADIQPVHDHHCQTGLKVIFAAHREPGGSQQ
jgi:hypothetical protein